MQVSLIKNAIILQLEKIINTTEQKETKTYILRKSSKNEKNS